MGEIVKQTLIQMAFAMFRTIALANSMNVVFAMDKAFCRANAIVKEMWMQMATEHAIIWRLGVVWIQRPATLMNPPRLMTHHVSIVLAKLCRQGVILCRLNPLPVQHQGSSVID